MNTYHYYQDRLIKSVEQTNFTVRASSQEEADAFAKTMADINLGNFIAKISDAIDIGETETVELLDTEKYIPRNFSTKDRPTVSVYNDDGEEIANDCPSDNELRIEYNAIRKHLSTISISVKENIVNYMKEHGILEITHITDWVNIREQEYLEDKEGNSVDIENYILTAEDENGFPNICGNIDEIRIKGNDLAIGISEVYDGDYYGVDLDSLTPGEMLDIFDIVKEFIRLKETGVIDDFEEPIAKEAADYED